MLHFDRLTNITLGVLLKYRSFIKFWEPPILQGRIHGTELPGVSLKSSLVHSCQFRQLYPTYFAL